MKHTVRSLPVALLDRIGRVDVIIASLSLFAIAAVSVWGVFTRYVLSRPAAWIEELSLGLFVWLTFFGISVLARRGELVSIEFLLHLLPKKLSFFIKKILTTLLLTLSLGVIIFYGAKLALFSADRYTAILRIPYSFIYAGIPTGAAFTLYHVLRCTAAGPRFLENLIDEEVKS